MKALLVNPAFPDSYWSGRFALRFASRKSILPPLGLITVAALLPKSWTLRLIDLDTEPLTDQDLTWADVVMVTGMLVQKPSLHRVLERCRALRIRTVVGGPYATALPQELDLADHVVVGEGEEVVPVLAADLEAGRAHHLYKEPGKPDLTAAPLPRFDLLNPRAYHQMSLQYSRGCPFSCEFCDIIVMYGRKPRTKTSVQVIAELEAIRRTGFAGDVFFVDDNFIGNKRAVKEMLPSIAAWREREQPPLEFYTEASVNLADDLELVDLMTSAGFTAVFMGIETPSPESLKETRKLQNLRRDLVEEVHGLLDRGLDVWAGFILGFDNDGPDSFDQMIQFIQSASIPYAMVGMLGALPNTPLYARLEKEGRLRPDFIGDQFGLTNVVTRMPAAQMLDGYRKVLETVYHPDVYFRRCMDNLLRWKPAAGSLRPMGWRDVSSGLRALWGQGIVGRYRGSYWQFLSWVMRNCPEKLGRAIAQAAAGHHYITYTRDVVVPSLVRVMPEFAEPQPILAS
ncbi:MAG TPA: B12-binding domain-containing radical SAM protein [Candidatus Polarisedimenticolia bacterium]|nr:B12-binding domain-containing radical SAM protein [Candidatus Polarisedimenticolia bacterium]